MRFLHIADVHLGNQQYALAERSNDFFKAFSHTVNLALESNVQACVIAGDLFHKSSIDPRTLVQAENVFGRLRDNDVQTVMISGNHDRARYRDDYYSWLDYLDERKLVQLLSPTFGDDGAMTLEPQSGYTDIEGTRFIGIPWYGSSIRPVIQRTPDALQKLDWTDVDFSTLLLHAAVEGQMPDQPDCLLFSDLEPLRSHIDYLALGHLHKHYEHKDWIYNPGSLESCNVDEADDPRGAYLVEVTGHKTHQVKHIKTPSRPFFKRAFKVDRYETPQALMDAFERFIRAASRDASFDEEPVVRITLTGKLSFDRTQLDIDAIKRLVRDVIDCLMVDVKVDCIPLTFDLELDETLSREMLELQIFEERTRQDTRYSAHAPDWARLIQNIKRVALLKGDQGATIYVEISDFMRKLQES